MLSENAFGAANNGPIGQKADNIFRAAKNTKRTVLGNIANVQRRNPNRACKVKAEDTVQVSQPNRRGSQKESASQPFSIYVDPPKAKTNKIEIHDHVLSLHDVVGGEKTARVDSPMVVSPYECNRSENILQKLENTQCLKDNESEYEDDILNYLKKLAMENRPRIGYMNKQPDINYSMRSILVDWLIEVSEEFSMDNRTLYLAVAYIDRFLSLMSVQRSKLQLVGTASLFVAAKYEEVYPPDASDFVYVTDDTYTQEQLLRMEQLILKTLGHNVSLPTVVDFLDIFLAAVGCKLDENSELRFLAMYLCELTLLDSSTFLKYLPANIAASAILLTAHTLQMPICASTLMLKSGVNVAELMACMDDLQDAFKEAPTLKYKVVIQKYTAKYLSVATIKPVLQPFGYMF